MKVEEPVFSGVNCPLGEDANNAVVFQNLQALLEKAQIGGAVINIQAVEKPGYKPGEAFLFCVDNGHKPDFFVPPEYQVYKERVKVGVVVGYNHRFSL